MTSGSIVFVIGSLNVGGAERHLLAVLPALRRKGWNVEVLCLQAEGPLADELRKKGVPVNLLQLGQLSISSIRPRLVKLLAMFFACYMFFCRNRPSIAHFFLPEAYLIGGPAAILAGIKVRIMSRRSLNRYQLKYPLAATVERWLHRRMTLLVGNSRAVIADLSAEGVPASKLRLIYNGVDLSSFDFEVDNQPTSTRESLGIRADDLVMTIVANLIPYKGHADLLHALAGVRDRLPKSWRLVCVGRDDGIGANLVAMAKSLGIEMNVIWAGLRADVPRILLASDIGILSSHEEGFSNAVLEGMAAGLPMVVTDVGGNAEAVVQGETGVIVPPKNPDALGAAALAMALDERRREIGRIARARAEQSFSLQACVAAYESLYREVVGCKPERHG